MAKVSNPQSADSMATAGADAIDVSRHATVPVARYRSTLPRAARGAYKAHALMMRRAAAAWHSLQVEERTSWMNAAADERSASRTPVVDARTSAPRFARPSVRNGFAMFAREFARLAGSPPLTPDHPDRTEPLDMTELLTGSTYEARMIDALARTNGNLTIAMYQVSPNWLLASQNASPLMSRLLDQPTRRAQCRMLLGTPDGGSSLAALNDEAATIMATTGWTVRRAAPYPVLHAKLWLIEPGIVYAGSHNLSNRATVTNKEAGILTTASSVAANARDYLQGLWDAAA